MPMGGLYYEEFTVGMRIEHVLRRTVTEADNLIFSALTTFSGFDDPPISRKLAGSPP